MLVVLVVVVVAVVEVVVLEVVVVAVVVVVVVVVAVVEVIVVVVIEVVVLEVVFAVALVMVVVVVVMVSHVNSHMHVVSLMWQDFSGLLLHSWEQYILQSSSVHWHGNVVVVVVVVACVFIVVFFVCCFSSVAHPLSSIAPAIRIPIMINVFASILRQNITSDIYLNIVRGFISLWKAGHLNGKNTRWFYSLISPQLLFMHSHPVEMSWQLYTAGHSVSGLQSSFWFHSS